MSEILNEISAALQSGSAKTVKALVEQALSEGIPAKDILEQGLLAGMDIVAVKFKNNEVYVPEVLIAARAMNTGTALLKPYLAESGAKPLGKALIGTVKGDQHDIGKNLVRMMFEGKGIEVIDLGVDVPPEKFVEAYREHQADVVALSALLTTTMGEMKNTVQAFVEAGERGNVVIMVGGAPVTDTFRESIGADIYTADAASAAEAAKQAILKKKGA
ncbi:MAG: corrinoid protein [Oscillospiraceae bacterium]|jgi:5-methyltetrahydrofolate--homocysteine methyltransferase|nr:corrinoid protein [Oscillospiraceae bacterium]